MMTATVATRLSLYARDGEPYEESHAQEEHQPAQGDEQDAEVVRLLEIDAEAHGSGIDDHAAMDDAVTEGVGGCYEHDGTIAGGGEEEIGDVHVITHKKESNMQEHVKGSKNGSVLDNETSEGDDLLSASVGGVVHG